MPRLPAVPLCLLAVLPVAAAELALYVSPAGNDGCSGRLAQAHAAGTDGPLASLGAARAAVRAQRAWVGQVQRRALAPRHAAGTAPRPRRGCGCDPVARVE